VRTEGELRRQIAAAEHARTMAEEAVRLKDDFLATLSHELRTPLNAVLGWTNILLGHSVEPPMLERALRVIDRNAAAQARLIDDMLDMTRIVSGKLRLEIGPVDLVAAVMAAIDVVAPAAHAKNLSIHRSLGSRTRLINGDADRIQQIAWNVLANAVKFTPPGGSISVAIDEDEDGVKLVIADTGKGMAPEFLPHVFERFRQANSSVSRSEGGLGLGLALVRQLVEMHGGRIEVVSAGIGKGSTFTIVFPAVARDAEVGTLPRPAASDLALDSYRVLVVDDDPDWNDLLQTTLAAHGADVSSALDARGAFEIITGPADATPDLMIADIGMPEEDGYMLIRRVRALSGRAQKIAALAVTAYGSPEDQARALAAGYDAWRSKPIRPESVVSAAVDVLKSKRIPRRLRRPAKQLT
jgi:CheY-like chemotaxis protein